MSDTALGGDPTLGSSHLVARGPTFGELRGNAPSTPDVPAPTYGGAFGSYSGNAPRPHQASVSTPGPMNWSPPGMDVDISQYQHNHGGGQMPNLGGGSGEAAEGEAAGGAVGATEAGTAAETGAGAAAEGGAASIPEILGFL